MRYVNRYVSMLSLVLSLAVFSLHPQTSLADNSDNNSDPGNGNSDRSLRFSTTTPSPGQQITVTLIDYQDQKSQINFRFTDESSPAPKTSPEIGYWINGTTSDYSVDVPSRLIQGDTYDVTATENGHTYEGSLDIPADPGHQLPETPYAAIFPIILLGGFSLILLRRRKIVGSGPK